MNYLVILSGGTGTRMGNDIPKQYIKVEGKSILSYTLSNIDYSLFQKVVIVVSDSWKEYVSEQILPNFAYRGFIYAKSGNSRQESILNGLMALNEFADKQDIVIIHDAARANCSQNMFTKLIQNCVNVDGVMPVLPVKDTIYVSNNNGNSITGLLNRSELFVGQSPEAFKFGVYFAINKKIEKNQLFTVQGSSQIAYENGLLVKMIEGDEMNFKITTPSDLDRFISIVRGKNESTSLIRN